VILTHDGFTAEVGYEDGDRLMHGSVINTRAVLHFAGGNIEELRQAFADTIADYRKWCKERGVEPEKPYSGTLSLRITPELHRRVAHKAARVGESINQFIVGCLEEVA
jgi:predicted HicB family RNase H-like nuclease